MGKACEGHRRRRRELTEMLVARRIRGLPRAGPGAMPCGDSSHAGRRNKGNKQNKNKKEKTKTQGGGGGRGKHKKSGQTWVSSASVRASTPRWREVLLGQDLGQQMEVQLVEVRGLEQKLKDGTGQFLKSRFLVQFEVVLAGVPVV